MATDPAATSPSTPPPVSDDRTDHQALDDLSARLDTVRSNNPDISPENQAARGEAMGLGIKLASELIAALIVGGLLGYGADWIFKSFPLWFLVGLAFGLAAAFLNVLRLMKKMSDESASSSQDTARQPSETDVSRKNEI